MTRPVYASADRPIRCSSLTNLQKCAGFHVLERGDVLSDGVDGSPASDLGRAVGRVIQLYHEGLTPGDAVLQAEREACDRFPQADLTVCRKLTMGYMADDRNPPMIATHCELEVKLTIPAAPEDPTGLPIHLVGHIDQLRADQAGRLFLWDVKNGQGSGLDLLYSHAWQLSAYTLAAAATLNRVVHPGGVIRTRAYEPAKSDPSVVSSMFRAPWSLADCHSMMADVAFYVAHLRSGVIPVNPGVHCQWCPGVNPGNCARLLPAGAP